MPSMRAVLIRDGKSETAEGLYIGEAERPTLEEGDGRIIVKVRRTALTLALVALGWQADSLRCTQVICFGLNRMDIMQRAFLTTLSSSPRTLGAPSLQTWPCSLC